MNPSGIDERIAALTRGEWLPFLPQRLREPVARGVVQLVIAAVVLVAVAPFADLGWAERFAAGVLLAASLAIGFIPSLVTKSVNPVAAGVATFSQHNAQTPARSVVPAQR